MVGDEHSLLVFAPSRNLVRLYGLFKIPDVPNRLYVPARAGVRISGSQTEFASVGDPCSRHVQSRFLLRVHDLSDDFIRATTVFVVVEI